MTQADRQILFVSLGFLTVLLRNDVPREKQALRATAISGLIEAFCRDVLPEAFSDKEAS